MVKCSSLFLIVIISLSFLLGCQQKLKESPPVHKTPSRANQIPQPDINKAAKYVSEYNEPDIALDIKIKTTDTSEPNIVITEPVKVPETNMPDPITNINFYEKYATILTGYVDENGMADYNALKRKKLELNALLHQLDDIDPNEYESWSKKDKIALWINAYNIQMLKIITENYPIESLKIHRLFWPPSSIRHIPPVWTIGAEKWNDYKFLVMDEAFTLSEIEQRFFRKQFDEPRVFFAITHASLSSPPLRNKPYYGYKLNEQLDDQVRKFLASPHGLRIDQEKQTVYLSAILEPDWYGEQFIDKYGTDKKFKDKLPAARAILNFITNYLPQPDVSFLEVGNYSLKYINYDWRLNK